MDNTLDVQRDHESILNLAMNALEKSGLLYFSNNYRKFKMSQDILDQFDCKNIDEKCLS